MNTKHCSFLPGINPARFAEVARLISVELELRVQS